MKLVFFAGEEERALGSWHYAAGLRATAAARPVAINLEGVGSGSGLTYVPEDGFTFRRYASGDALPALLRAVARDAGLPPPAPAPLPPGTLTDARSFLARGIPGITIRGATDEGFPRRLHSRHDSRERLPLAAIEESVALLDALVRYVDTHPSALAAVDGASSGKATGPIGPCPWRCDIAPRLAQDLVLRPGIWRLVAYGIGLVVR